MRQAELVVMPSTARADGPSSHPSEHTPLLRSRPACQEDSNQSAEVAAQGEGGSPHSPELGKNPGYPHGQLVPDHDPASSPELENLVRFQENGILEGVGKWKFRFVFGGILLGYFVSRVLSYLLILYIPSSIRVQIIDDDQ